MKYYFFTYREILEPCSSSRFIFDREELEKEISLCKEKKLSYYYEIVQFDT